VTTSPLSALLAAAVAFHAGEVPFTFQAPEITAQLGVASSTIQGIIWYPVATNVAEVPQSVVEGARLEGARVEGPIIVMSS